MALISLELLSVCRSLFWQPLLNSTININKGEHEHNYMIVGAMLVFRFKLYLICFQLQQNMFFVLYRQILREELHTVTDKYSYEHILCVNGCTVICSHRYQVLHAPILKLMLIPWITATELCSGTLTGLSFIQCQAWWTSVYHRGGRYDMQ